MTSTERLRQLAGIVPSRPNLTSDGKPAKGWVRKQLAYWKSELKRKPRDKNTRREYQSIAMAARMVGVQAESLEEVDGATTADNAGAFVAPPDQAAPGPPKKTEPPPKKKKKRKVLVRLPVQYYGTADVKQPVGEQTTTANVGDYDYPLDPHPQRADLRKNAKRLLKGRTSKNADRLLGLIDEMTKPHLNKYDPGSLLGWTVFLLKKHGLEDAADDVRQVSRKVSRAWQHREE